MLKSSFVISQMDCPSEEQLIRMKLEGNPQVKKLDFDLEKRILQVIHLDDVSDIEKQLSELKLGSKLLETVESTETFTEELQQKKLLWYVLAINFAFFIIEMSTGIISRSMGLVADSLDMLADSFVYGISLFAVGGNLMRKKKVARLAGYFQLTLAILGFVEVLRRFFGMEGMPDYKMMMIVAFLALLANALCLYLLQKSKSREAHMRASMIFTSNDILINIGVILAGFLVNVFHSNKPDLIVGSIVFLLVLQGAFRILKIGK